LLAAKLLFVFAYVYLPLYLGQSIMLWEAGFNALLFVNGILHNLILLTGILILPVFAVATVTKNFIRATFVAFIILLGFIGVLLLTTVVLGGGLPSPYADFVEFILFFVLCIAACLLQFSTRKVLRSRIVLVVLFLSVSILIVTAPDRYLMGVRYPMIAGSQQSPVAFSNNHDPALGPSAFVAKGRNLVGLRLALDVSDIPDSSLIMVDAVRATIESQNGKRWSGDWQPIYDMKLVTKFKLQAFEINIPLSVYEELQSRPVALQLTFAFAEARKAHFHLMAVPATDFTVPDFGICKPLPGYSIVPGEIEILACRSRLRQPKLTQIKVNWTSTPCNAPTSEKDKQFETYTWAGNFDEQPGGWGIESVFMPQPVVARNYYGQEGWATHLCPGDPVSFTQYELAQRAQVKVLLDNFQLPALTPTQYQMITKPN
jgi:hypothetical protein